VVHPEYKKLFVYLNTVQLQNHRSLVSRRRELRNRPTKAKHLWYQLRGAKVDGRKFRRQHSIGPYIIDFYCPEEKLAIELDGDIHDEPAQKKHDEERTRYLNTHGVRVLRFPNRRVLTDQQSILDEIRRTWKGRER
jgi:very-short-patch-repair endonuclease